jgi:hypothetical protein
MHTVHIHLSHDKDLRQDITTETKDIYIYTKTIRNMGIDVCEDEIWVRNIYKIITSKKNNKKKL